MPKDYSEDLKNFFFNEQNKKKQKELEERYGMVSNGESEEATPELMNNFLNYVEQYEKAYKNAEEKKIIEIIGYPEFKKLEDLNPGEVLTELERVLDIYAEHSIIIDIIEKDDVTDEEFYKFLTEELTEHETYHMQIEGMTANFIYEEFHPSKKLDAKDAVKFLSWPLFDRNEEGMDTWLSKENLVFNGENKSLSQFKNELLQLIPENVVNHDIVYKNFDLGEVNKVETEFVIEYKSTQQEDEKSKVKILNLLFELEEDECDGFVIRVCNKQ
ncbi:MAG: hypothetical protein EHM58_09210 [Ignavibacteriae bacterium]|nr:MAG: hypothetical protein EHM58_09210 [Ignavibacteriota bacterium]